MSATTTQGPFDVVIVGAGSAGCCLAGRLSADPACRVALLEAGPSNNSWRIRVPAALVNLMRNPRYNWMLESVPQTQLHGRRLAVPRGKTLGGSSSINSMVYIRGQPADYDAWAAAGCDGWDWASVLPYFKRSERNLTHDGPLHGDSGPLIVGELPSPHPLCESWAEAGVQAGIGRNEDFNGPTQQGLGTYQVTMRRGRRHSCADAFLTDARRRPNLSVFTRAEVARIEFDRCRATGVRLRGGENRRVSVAGELVIAAGAVGSPALLLASGIGPAEELERLGIGVTADLPGVGRNLQEHPSIGIVLKAAAGRGLALATLPSIAWAPIEYALTGRGMLSTNHVEAGGFARTSFHLEAPDLQFHMIPARVGVESKGVVWGRGFYADVCLLKPRSRGRLWLEREAGALVTRLDYNVLSDPDDRDRLVAGFQVLRSILGTEALQRFSPSELSPGAAIQSREDILEHCRRRLGTAYHPVGTCQMGPASAADTVVDPKLRVQGLANVRVADASVMPEIVSGNTNAPTVMIAERGADLILGAGAGSLP